MSPCGSTLEEQLSSIMDVLAKAAVSEISLLFSAILHLQKTRSLKENEALRTRMKVMRRELKEKEAPRMKVRRELRMKVMRRELRMKVMRRELRDNIGKPRTEPLGNGELSPDCDVWKTGRAKCSGGTISCYICSYWKHFT